MDHGINQTKRIEVIDALRGFAIFAILLIHSSNHFLYQQGPEYTSEWLKTFDDSVLKALYFIFEGKIYSVFALLFGFTLALQIDKRKGESKLIMGRFLWRMVLLLMLGLFNGAFFSGGDPLVFYAIIMAAMLPLFWQGTKIVAFVATIFLLQPAEIVQYVHPFMEITYGKYYEVAQATLVQGNFIDTALTNMKEGIQGALMWGFETGRWSQTAGLFLLGIIAYRKHFFQQDLSFYKRYGTIALLATVILYGLSSYTQIEFVKMYYNLAYTSTIICLFCIVHLKWGKNNAFKSLALYGKMSLTHFIGQSVICAFIFYPWGLHLAPYLGVAASVTTAFGVFILQLSLGKYWLKTHKQGPFEYLWHRLTWINIT